VFLNADRVQKNQLMSRNGLERVGRLMVLSKKVRRGHAVEIRRAGETVLWRINQKGSVVNNSIIWQKKMGIHQSDRKNAGKTGKKDCGLWDCTWSVK